MSVTDQANNLQIKIGDVPVVEEINQLSTGERERKVIFSLRKALTILAISVHSVFESMAIGND